MFNLYGNIVHNTFQYLQHKLVAENDSISKLLATTVARLYVSATAELELFTYFYVIVFVCLQHRPLCNCNVESDTEHITDEELLDSDNIEHGISGAGNQAADDSSSSDEDAYYHFPLYEGCPVSEC